MPREHRYTRTESHPHPSSEVDHDVVIDAASVDFAHDKLNEQVSSPEMLDVAKFPTAECKGQFTEFSADVPKTSRGELTLHGVTKPLTFSINSFKCFERPMLKKQVCGADAEGTFNRADFGVNYRQQYGFKQDALLRIQVEGIKIN
jgi:polyisoprenoid-binding protein YceI